MDAKKIFYLTVVFWLLIFSGLVTYNEFTLRTGTEVILKTDPVDPRDLFRGDYVTLRYEISTLSLREVLAEDTQFEYNDRIYLALDLKDGYGVPKKLYKNPPKDEIYIKGRAKSFLYDITNKSERNTSVRKLRAEYGIEKYFVPEGRGREIESQRRDGKRIDVKVAVDRFGNAVIKKLLIDGNETKF